MPTQEKWIDRQTISTVWQSPLRSDEVAACFSALVMHITKSEETTNILFDVHASGHIPAQAPFLFSGSGITKQRNLGHIVVIGANPIAKILANLASTLTKKGISFFATETDAMSYLKESASN